MNISKPPNIFFNELSYADRSLQRPDTELKKLNSLFNRVVRYAQKLDYDYLNYDAWFTFRAWQDLHYNPLSPWAHIFKVWQLFHWLPDPKTVHIPHTQGAATIATSYLASGQHEDCDEELVKIISMHFPDIFEVTDLSFFPLVGLTGIVSKKSVHIIDLDIRKSCRIGDFVFAQIVPQNDRMALLMANGPVIPRKYRSVVLEFKEFLDKRTLTRPDKISDLESDIFNLIFDLSQALNTSAV